MFEQPPPQTDWTQDLDQLLLGGRSTSVSPSPLPSPSLSAPVLPPSYDHPSCHQSIGGVDEDFDLDELLLRLTGHGAIQPSPTVASDLPPPFMAEVQELSTTAVFPSPSPVPPPGLPCTEATPMPAQEIVLSLSSPASLNALAEQFFDGYEHRTRTPTVPSAPSLLGSGYATAEGSPDLGVEPYLHPGVALGSTALFDWTTLAGAILPPHAEPSLVTDHDGEGEGVPGQSERSESFELVSPPSISSAVNGGGGNDHADARAWWTDFAGLAPPFSTPQPLQLQPDPQGTLKLEQGQGQQQQQQQLLVVELGDAISPQVQIEPLDGHLQIDGDLVNADTEVVGQQAGELQVQITGQAPEIPFDPQQSLEPSLPLSPSVVLQDLGPVTSQRLSSLPPPFQHPSHQHAAKKCPCPFCVSLPIKGRERKRKAVVINEDTVCSADGGSNGDAKAAQKGPVKRRKSESANAKPRTKRTKEPSRKKKGAGAEETTKVTNIDEPIREKMFVTTDEKGRLKMLPLRTRAKQHDDEVGSSANANPQPPQAQLLLSQVEVPSPPPRPPQAKPMVPRRILPLPDTVHPLVSLATQPLAGRIQNASNTLLEPRVPTVPMVPVVSTSVLQHETPRTLLALADPHPHPHPPSHLVSSLPAARAPAPCSTSPVGSIVAPLPRYAASYNHFESWNVGFTDMELESEAQLLNALPVPIRRRHPVAPSCYAFGTGVVDTHSQADVRQGASIQSQYQPHATPVYSDYPFVHGYHQHKSPPVPAPAPAPLPLESYAHAEIPQSRYYHLGAPRQTQRMQQTQQTQVLQDSLVYAAPSMDPYQHAQHHHHHHHQRYHHQPSFDSLDSYQGHLPPAPYSHQHPDTNHCAQMPIEPLYLSQYAHGPYISEYYHPYV
jgi:hypothetical protein